MTDDVRDALLRVATAMRASYYPKRQGTHRDAKELRRERYEAWRRLEDALTYHPTGVPT